MPTISEVSDADVARVIAKGDGKFVDEDWEGALECYSEAAAMSSPPASAVPFSKKAAAHLKLENYTDAIADANRAIEADPSLAVSYLRKGLACFELEEVEAALRAFEEGARLEPKNSQLAKWVRKCRAELGEEESTPAQQPEPQPSSGPPAAAPAALAAAPAAAPAPPPPRYRHEWYQSPSHVVVTVFAKGLRQEQVQADFGEQVLSVVIAPPEGASGADAEPYRLFLRLFGKVSPAECTCKVLSTKVEIRLGKAEAIHWTGLEAAARQRAAVAQPINVSSDAAGAVKSQYPSSSKHKVDWNTLEKEVKEEEKEEEKKLEGDAGLNKFFQMIYGDADEETRRAMNKSFVESGGTVLSTNWKEVGSKKIERKD